MPPVGASTPSAPYRASTRSTAACTMRRSVASSSTPVGDGEDRVEQALHPAPGRDDLGQPLLHLAQQLVESQAGLHVGHRE